MRTVEGSPEGGCRIAPPDGRGGIVERPRHLTVTVTGYATDVTSQWHVPPVRDSMTGVWGQWERPKTEGVVERFQKQAMMSCHSTLMVVTIRSPEQSSIIQTRQIPTVPSTRSIARKVSGKSNLTSA